MSQSRNIQPSQDAQPRGVQSPEEAGRSTATSKPEFARPKLTFVSPKLVKHGDVTELTGFFGAVSP